MAYIEIVQIFSGGQRVVTLVLLMSLQGCGHVRGSAVAKIELFGDIRQLQWYFFTCFYSTFALESRGLRG